VALLLVLRRGDDTRSRRTTLTFLVVLLAQGAVGGIQSLIGIPEVLVAIHVLGAALVWVGALRVLLDVDTRLFRTADRQVTARPIKASAL
jgi:cytochrome c oxidase assembly protein subunit 15